MLTQQLQKEQRNTKNGICLEKCFLSVLKIITTLFSNIPPLKCHMPKLNAMAMLHVHTNGTLTNGMKAGQKLLAPLYMGSSW